MKVQVIIWGNLEGVINFDTQTYELLNATPYFSRLTDLPITFEYMSNRLRTAVKDKKMIHYQVSFDVLDDIQSGDVFFHDNAGKIRFVVE